MEPLDGGGYSVDGGARVDELEEALGMTLPEEGFPTLGGRVFEQLQRRPRVGDEVDLGTFHARVLEVDGMRISRVQLEPFEPETHAHEQADDNDGDDRTNGAGGG